MTFDFQTVIMVSIVSMVIVYLVLAGLMLLMELMSVLVKKSEQQVEKKAQFIEQEKTAHSFASTSGKSLYEFDELAKVAAIMALILSSETSGKLFKIKSLKRVK